MRTKVTKLLALVMVLTFMLSSYSVAFAMGAEAGNVTVSNLYSFKTDAVSNEQYMSGAEPESQEEVSLTISDAEMNTALTDKTILAQTLRDNMVNRQAVTTLVYKTDTVLTQDNVSSFIDTFRDEIIALAFTEENAEPYEGDYLSRSWNTVAFQGAATERTMGEATEYFVKIQYTYTYKTTKAQEDELTTALNEKLDEFDFTASTTDIEKVEEIYSYITSNVNYDFEGLNDSNDLLKFTAYGALIENSAVCEGFSLLFYLFAETCGLDSRFITGMSDGDNPEAHSWNIVKLGDYYYYLDATWDEDATLETYRYYLKGTEGFTGHVIDSEFTGDFYNTYPVPQADYYVPVMGIDGDFTYKAVNGVATITAYNGAGGEVVVPANVDGYPVYSVGEHAFGGEHDEFGNAPLEETITKITFEEGIKCLAPEAIWNCIALKEINYSSTMFISGERYNSTSPVGCNQLETITVPESNPYIKVMDGVLYNKDGTMLLQCPPKYPKTVFVVPESVKYIGSGAFSDCLNINTIDMAEYSSVIYISVHAFLRMSNLHEVKMSENCIEIDQYAFMYTGVIEKLRIPETLLYLNMGGLDFAYFNEFEVDENNQVFYVEDGGLYAKKYYKNVSEYFIEYIDGIILHKVGLDYFKTLPNKHYEISEGTEAIDYGAFENAEVNSIIVPNTVEAIRRNAFNSTHLITADIPSSVTIIDLRAGGDIHGGSSLTIYGEQGSVIEEYAKNHGADFKEGKSPCTNGHKMVETVLSSSTDFRKDTVYICSECNEQGVVSNHLYKNFDTDNIKVELESTSFQYTGNPIEPEIVSMKDSEGNSLVEGVDYKILGYGNNVDSGNNVAFIHLKGMGDYQQITMNVYYSIIPLSFPDLIEGKVTFEDVEYDGWAHHSPNNLNVEGLTHWDDYQIEIPDYETGDYTNPGKKTVFIVPVVSSSGIYNYVGKYKIEYNIIPKRLILGKSVSKENFFVTESEIVYDGTEKKPEIFITVNDVYDDSYGSLVEGKDYTLTFKNNINAGTATAVVTGKGNYQGTVETNFTILPANANSWNFTFENPKPGCNNVPQKPKVTVTLGDLVCVEGVDYTVSYFNNTSTGIASIIVTGKGNLCESICKDFEITLSEHSFSEAIGAKSATCTEAGYTGDNKCSVCGYTEKGSMIPATGHNWENWVTTKEPTYDAEGVSTKVCSICGAKETKVIAKLERPKTLEMPVVTTIVGKGGITVNWEMIDGAEYYTIYRKDYSQKKVSWKAIRSKYTGTSFVDDTAKFGVTYEYTVRAVSGTIKSKYKTAGKKKFDVKPTVKISNASNGVKVTWGKVYSAEKYIVYRSEYTSKGWSSWKALSNKVTSSSYTDKAAKSGKKYRYTVRAVRGSVKSSYNKSPSSIIYLAQPTVKISNTSSGIKVSWKKISGAKGYTVYSSEYKNGKWTSWKNRGTTKSSTTSWTDKKVKSGVQYRYTVRAVNGNYKSTYKGTSGLMFLTMPKATVKAVSNGVKVSWGLSDGATGYTVYRSEYNTKTKKWSSWKSLGTKGSKTKSYTDKKAKKGVKYKYAVKAVNKNTGAKSAYTQSKTVKR